MRVLVTRADPASALDWRARGATVIAAPLLAVAARAWCIPADGPEAIAFTSANGVRFAGAASAAWRALPVFAVGLATAAAATAAGWRDVRDGGGSAETLFGAVAAAGFGAVLHLAGVDRTPVVLPPGLRVTVREVYAATLIGLSPEAVAALAAGTIDVVALTSPRAAAHFAGEIDRAELTRAAVALAALSPAIAAAAGSGWRAIEVAKTLGADALFAAALRLCDKRSAIATGA